MPEPKQFDIGCPWCGHSCLWYGEETWYRDEKRADVFSCRDCGQSHDESGIQKLIDEYQAALNAVRVARQEK